MVKVKCKKCGEIFDEHDIEVCCEIVSIPKDGIELQVQCAFCEATYDTILIKIPDDLQMLRP